MFPRGHDSLGLYTVPGILTSGCPIFFLEQSQSTYSQEVQTFIVGPGSITHNRAPASVVPSPPAP